MCSRSSLWHQLSTSIINLAHSTHLVELCGFSLQPASLSFTCLLLPHHHHHHHHDLHNVVLCSSDVWPSSHVPACHRIGIQAELIQGLPNALLGPASIYPTSALSLFHSACCLPSLQLSIQKQSWVIKCISTEIKWITAKTQCLCKPHLYPSFTLALLSKPLTVLFLWVACCQIGAYTSGELFLRLT